MTDFFDDLERQLVTATPQRGARIRRARARRIGAVAASVAVLLAGGVGIAAAVGSPDGSGGPDGAPAGTTATTVPAASITPPSTAPEPDAYTVAILNGTTIPGLGRSVATRLQTTDRKIGNVTNAPTAGHTQTTVYYRSARCVPAAEQVASALRLANAQGSVTVHQVPRALRAVAGRADVVVLVGSDQNHPVGP